MDRSDVIVIGAGLLGCFLARALRRQGLSVIVLEQSDDVCTGISRSGSGIVYPGYDMAPGSLKAALTVRSCRDFPALCRDLSVNYRACGSLMTGAGPRAEAVIRRKYVDGVKNGVPGLELLDGDACRRMEPLLSANITCGLYAPGTCAVNPWELGIAAFENARDNGARFVFSEKVTALSRQAEGFSVCTENGAYTCRDLINAAGLSADSVHELISRPSVRLKVTGADYLLLEDGSADALSHVIFHEPEEKGKGLTLIPTADGNLLIGPTERDVPSSGDDALYPAGGTDPAGPGHNGPQWAGAPTEASGIRWLRERCHEVVPELDTEKVLRSFGAARPRPYLTGADQNKSLRDFVILEEDHFYSLIGIKTPGMTCAAALGEHLAAIIAQNRGIREPDPAFDPIRKRPVIPRECSFEERQVLVRSHPAYGRILCACRDVTEGEVRDAVHRGATTVEAVRRRTGAMMGTCQGGRCLAEIQEVIQDELGC